MIASIVSWLVVTRIFRCECLGTDLLNVTVHTFPSLHHFTVCIAEMPDYDFSRVFIESYTSFYHYTRVLYQGKQAMKLTWLVRALMTSKIHRPPLISQLSNQYPMFVCVVIQLAPLYAIICAGYGNAAYANQHDPCSKTEVSTMSGGLSTPAIATSEEPLSLFPLFRYPTCS